MNYFENAYYRNICIQRLLKPTSNDFGPILKEVNMKLQEKRSIVGLRCLRYPWRCNIRVKHPRKPPSKDFGSILYEINMKLQKKRSTLCPKCLGYPRRCNIRAGEGPAPVTISTRSS